MDPQVFIVARSEQLLLEQRALTASRSSHPRTGARSGAKATALIASAFAAVSLLGCARGATASVASAAATGTPINRTYMVESHELIEVSRFEDGSVKYSPTGFMVFSTPAMATATAAADRQ